jgi:hypothetical protein
MVKFIYVEGRRTFAIANEGIVRIGGEKGEVRHVRENGRVLA